MSFTPSSQKGFVILLAVLISASILMIGAGIFSSAFKQTILASTSTESQIALFVADTGMDCALYNEFVVGGLEAPSSCADEATEVIDVNNTSAVNSLLVSYEFKYTIPGTPGCGKVSVSRNVGPNGGDPGSGDGTNIIARGYNFCDGQDNPDTTNPTLVERRLEVWYPNASTLSEDEAAAAAAAEAGGG